MTSSTMAQQQPKIRAVFFDFMGTCLNWHASVMKCLPSPIPKDEASEFALEWRRQYFIEISKRYRRDLQPEDVDITFARVLNNLLEQSPKHAAHFNSSVKARLIEAWHSQPAWAEVPEAIQNLRDDLGLEVFVHANGTTRLQLDLVRFSGLSFNMLFSSQLLGVYKPSPDAYNKALELVQLKPEEVVLVAAHAYDLRGAKKVGMKTVYVHRWTDDVDEDMEKVKSEFNAFLEDMTDLPNVIASL
ncbi:haloacid dehalogenase [Colletotrichum navitas]|uniref:Haloacid dehalogenase n=1 Tax=Colletotrichum navitas TaxID=681940 RepID=A0AAD8Q1E0_9PEZI|nr:haloacid dehalogenase [Colletotrichum navitas]KAK1593546.1 haloacid dehalogenase [Colletotrichum navitas]